ncbi:reverse transcriptase [Reticulomyxa filosa]|uniref:Reverse transcriptase n=1 Tax=Reticulomyxa filosa TaxID=46433 RepID=X6M3K5_RETFI|nr:reverse transcriptase [Reticulomyxa filosa]|eukprot:ETO07605.1 reverse transcriptase [Reticulomyxa filosa]
MYAFYKNVSDHEGKTTIITSNIHTVTTGAKQGGHEYYAEETCTQYKKFSYLDQKNFNNQDMKHAGYKYHKTQAIFQNEDNQIRNNNNLSFHLDEFQKEIDAASKITKHIIIGGDWNAHHPAWLDKDIDDVGETILQFIISNNLHILNTYPYDKTFYKNGSSSSIDISLCSASLIQYCNNWRTDQNELDVESDHLPITFNIATKWTSMHIKRQYIESWNLRSNNWEMYTKQLEKNLQIWKTTICTTDQNENALDSAVNNWTNCVIQTGKDTIGMKMIWKGNKPWWSNALQRQRKKVHRLKRKFRKYNNETNYKRHKDEAKALKRNLRREKQEFLTKNIELLTKNNMKQLFAKFRSMNYNKISLIPTLTKPATEKEQSISA